MKFFLPRSIVFFLFVAINVLLGSPLEEIQYKAERALACNAKFTNISDVKVTTLENSTQYKGFFYAEGVYRSVLAVGGHKSGVDVGDEFHPSSGTFEALIDENLKITKMFWKVGLFHGVVKAKCLRTTQRRF